MFLARLLSPEDYGLVGIALAVNAIGAIFLNLGLSSAIIQAEQSTQQQLSTIFWLNLSIGLVLFVIISLFAKSISGFYKTPKLENVLIITSLTIPFSTLGSIHNALLVKHMKFKAISIRSSIIALFSGVVGIIMAYNHYGVWALITQTWVNLILGNVILFVMVKFLPSFQFNLRSISDKLKFGKYMFLSGVLESVYSRIDVFLIGKVFSMQTLGLYTRAYSLDNISRHLSASSLLSVLFSKFAQIKNDLPLIQETFLKYYEIIAFLFCMIGGVLFILSPTLFTLLYGNNWLEASVYFQLLLLSSVAYPLSSLMLSAIEARGNSKYFFKVEVIKKIIFLPAYLVAWIWGIKVFLLAVFVSTIFGVIANMVFLYKEIGIEVSRLGLILIKYYITGQLFAIAIYFLMAYHQSHTMVVLSSFVFITGYLVFHALIKSKAWLLTKVHIPFFR